jgi:hypothetical protein
MPGLKVAPGEPALPRHDKSCECPADQGRNEAPTSVGRQTPVDREGDPQEGEPGRPISRFWFATVGFGYFKNGVPPASGGTTRLGGARFANA